MLPHFGADLVDVLMEKFGEVGIEVNVRTLVTAIEKNGSGFSVMADANSKVRKFEADLVVHAAGRGPALEQLNLGAGGVAHDNGRLELNEFLQSVSNPAVYAAGDAAQFGPPLTPVSSHDARVVAANLLHGNRAKPNYLGVPSVAFTIPPIAAVRLSEREARSEVSSFASTTKKLRIGSPHDKRRNESTPSRSSSRKKRIEFLALISSDRMSMKSSISSLSRSGMA